MGVNQNRKLLWASEEIGGCTEGSHAFVNLEIKVRSISFLLGVLSSRVQQRDAGVELVGGDLVYSRVRFC